jgi:sulfotransferase
MIYNKKFYFLSGLPRCGSTLLSAILSQNPLIYSGGNSPVCQLMWDMQVSVNTSSQEQILANNKLHIANNLISNIPYLYYQDVTENIVFDKCRSWTLKPNLDLIKNYITNEPKIILLIRPIHEIINSFCDLYKKNKLYCNPEIFLEEYSEPIMRSLDGVIYILKNESKENYILIKYDELVSNTSQVIKNIYTFLELDYFEHRLDNLFVKDPEDDTVYGLNGMHSIRGTVSKRYVKNYLSNKLLDKCKEIDKLIE